MDCYPAADCLSAATAAAVERFNVAFNGQDVAAALAAMTGDCVFEITYPAPDGQRCAGQDAVRHAFEEFVAASPTARFDVEDAFAAGDRADVRWR
jgi:ketosteroid isomerase-like protein